MGVIAKKIILKNGFKGEPKLDDFEIQEEPLRPLQNGEFILQAEYLSVDPYMRVYMGRFPDGGAGQTMIGGQVGRVIESKNPRFAKGAIAYAHVGWRTYSVVNPEEMDRKPYVLPKLGNLPHTLGLGALGMPGNTAYFGLLEICKPKAGETLVVSGAAGAVGSLVGQIGKIKGLRVIGIAGSDDKCKWLVDQLGYDVAINYKTANLEEELKNVAPSGFDCYFDNVGGEISSVVLNQMNEFGRISVCGSISAYNADLTNYPTVPDLAKLFNWKQLRMEGFIVHRWTDRWMEGIKQMAEWISQGKIKCEETVTNGFENMPIAFTQMLKGANTGKAIVKV